MGKNWKGAPTISVTHHEIADSRALHLSYGSPVSGPHGVIAANVVALGWMAGSGDVVSQRDITTDDSVRSGVNSNANASARGRE